MEISSWLRHWSRKFHIYLGLYFLFFLWLFSVTGLFLNHPKWEFIQFWGERQQSSWEKTVDLPTEPKLVDQARTVMHQLNIRGEMERIELTPDERTLKFRVVRPGRIIDVTVERPTRQARVEQIRVNHMGVLNMLHSFTGVRMQQPELSRDWWLTNLWSLSMDAVCLGMIVLVLSGWIIWYLRRRDRLPGLIVLMVGVISCGLFVFARFL